MGASYTQRSTVVCMNFEFLGFEKGTVGVEAINPVHLSNRWS